MTDTGLFSCFAYPIDFLFLVCTLPVRLCRSCHNATRRRFFALLVMHTVTFLSHSSKAVLVGLLLISGIVLTSRLSAAGTCSLSFGFQNVPTSTESGATLTRTVQVKNTGTATCRSASFSMFYGTNERFASSTPHPTADTYYWYLGTLKPNKKVSVAISTRHDPRAEGARIVTEGCAAAAGARDACAASSVSIVQAPPVSVLVEEVSAQLLSQSATTTIMSEPTSDTKEKGIWIWNFPGDMLSDAADQQLQALSRYGFNAVYITIDDYIDVARMPEGTSKELAKKTYFDTLAKFVAKVQGYGMKVDTEGGAKDWAQPENRWKGFALIDAMKEYNARYPAQKIRAFQYDVEPYLLPEYERNKAAVLLDFVTFIDQSVERLESSDIALSAAIPHFYDGALAWTPSFAYNGSNAHAFTHLLTILERKQGSMLLLMSYRDTFEGANGTRAISESEIREASNGYHTKVIVGQETGNVDPAHVTYFGESKHTVLQAATTVSDAFKGYAQFGGVAIHYLDSFLAMDN